MNNDLIMEKESDIRDFSKYKDNGLTGLVNLGNTCFINTTLQCLSHTYELNKFLENDYTKFLNKDKSRILEEYNELRELMWSRNCIISPNKFLRSIHEIAQQKDRDIFTGFAQNDLPEFLYFIIDCFHEAIQREVDMEIKGESINKKDDLAIKCYTMIKNMYSKEYSEILKIFYGIHVSSIYYEDSNKCSSQTPEPFFIINLPIPDIQDISLIDCFKLYTQMETLDENNFLIDEETGEKHLIKRQIKFFKLPDVLIIDLKRFNNMGHKNQKNVEIPLNNLDLSEFVNGYNKSQYVYDLYGVCNHYGSVLGGHYTANVLNANGKWYLFNDRVVQEIKKTSNIITNNAYCLFYRKKIIR
jgi:ubiquitin carboxyl-terminal hydrolase 8